MVKKHIKLLIATFLLLILAAVHPVSASETASGIQAPALSPDQVISQINAYRTANGLAALSYNPTLAYLAQAHSDFMASTGDITHYEAGTTPTDRAYAAGYGGGNKIFLSEIIYGGWNADVSDAITWWKNSSIHNHVMLDSQYLEIGAGVTTSGNMTYFTAVIAWVTGIAAPSDSSSGSGSGSSDSDDSSEVIIYSPVVLATPLADGSIVHSVEGGQTLWTIAAVYKVDLQTIYDLNNLNAYSYIFPGDQIIIRPAGSYPTQTPDQSGAPQPTQGDTAIGEAFSSAPTQAQGPTILPTMAQVPTQPDGQPSPLPTLAVTPTPSTAIIEDPTARWMIIIAFVIIFGVVVGSFFFQKPAQRPPRQD